MKKIPLFLLAGLLLFLTWAFAAEDISQDLNNGIVRLHILANSDSPSDQALKLRVRDRLLIEADSAPALLSDAEILSFCRDEIQQSGYEYPVSLQRGRFYFPRKDYENLTLPAGNYNAVRIVLGDGNGQNWWCVMYPPLCFTVNASGTMNDTALRTLQSTLSPETYSMICESNHIAIKPTFRLVELWQELKAMCPSVY